MPWTTATGQIRTGFRTSQCAQASWTLWDYINRLTRLNSAVMVFFDVHRLGTIYGAIINDSIHPYLRQEVTIRRACGSDNNSAVSFGNLS